MQSHKGVKGRMYMKNIIKENIDWIDCTWRKIDKKMSNIAIKSRDKIPYTTIDGVHDNRGEKEPDWWTNGFWSGMMWILYSQTKNEEYKKTAISAEKILDKAFEDFTKLHHDVGFMWHLSSGANFRLTGDKKAYNKTLYAAAMLASRYNIDGKYIRAWNGGDYTLGWTIIDTMMNIPLLYWASREIGDARFKKIAMSHADMVLRDHIRPDGSINHIVEHNPETGEITAIPQGQGYNPDSCWTRGLAWAIYGTVLTYIHTDEKRYLECAKKTADYFVKNIKAYDYKTPIDFKAPKTPVYYDSTAGVCTACGLLELAKNVETEKAKEYTETAIELLKATDKFFCDYSDREDALVLKGSERYPTDSDYGLHIPIIYGDFFFVEAMAKLKGNEFLIW